MRASSFRPSPLQRIRIGLGGSLPAALTRVNRGARRLPATQGPHLRSPGCSCAGGTRAPRTPVLGCTPAPAFLWKLLRVKAISGLHPDSLASRGSVPLSPPAVGSGPYSPQDGTAKTLSSAPSSWGGGTDTSPLCPAGTGELLRPGLSPAGSGQWRRARSERRHRPPPRPWHPPSPCSGALVADLPAAVA